MANRVTSLNGPNVANCVEASSAPSTLTRSHALHRSHVQHVGLYGLVVCAECDRSAARILLEFDID